MIKLVNVVVIISLTVACCAQPGRLVKNKQLRLARQELTTEELPSQTPYPPAGIVPEIPFDLPSEGSSLEPENTYLPPDNQGGIPAQTYGPPDATDISEVTDVDVSAAEDEVKAEQPEVLEVLEQPQEQNATNEEADDNKVNNQQFERLVRRRPAKLIASKVQVFPAVAVPPQRLVAQPIQNVVPQSFIYANGKFFVYNPILGS